MQLRNIVGLGVIVHEQLLREDIPRDISVQVWMPVNSLKNLKQIQQFFQRKKNFDHSAQKKYMRKLCLGKKVFENFAQIKRHLKILPKKKRFSAQDRRYLTVLPKKYISDNSAQEKSIRQFRPGKMRQELRSLTFSSTPR